MKFMLTLLTCSYNVCISYNTHNRSKQSRSRFSSLFRAPDCDQNDHICMQPFLGVCDIFSLSHLCECSNVSVTGTVLDIANESHPCSLLAIILSLSALCPFCGKPLCVYICHTFVHIHHTLCGTTKSSTQLYI